jgi:hypothetical protein
VIGPEVIAQIKDRNIFIDRYRDILAATEPRPVSSAALDVASVPTCAILSRGVLVTDLITALGACSLLPWRTSSRPGRPKDHQNRLQAASMTSTEPAPPSGLGLSRGWRPGGDTRPGVDAALRCGFAASRSVGTVRSTPCWALIAVAGAVCVTSKGLRDLMPRAHGTHAHDASTSQPSDPVGDPRVLVDTPTAPCAAIARPKKPCVKPAAGLRPFLLPGREWLDRFVSTQVSHGYRNQMVLLRWWGRRPQLLTALSVPRENRLKVGTGRQHPIEMPT